MFFVFVLFSQSGPELFDQNKKSSDEVSPTPPVLELSTDALNTNTSCKYDNITCKDLIQSGPPVVYQLIPKKENIGTIQRMTLGKKDPNKTHRTILLVGETGTGKSTMINALINYDMGVKWEDDVWFEIIEKDRKRRKSEGQTSDVIVYQIFGFEDKTLPYSLTIIDTPGYGDIRGTEHDDTITHGLLDLLRSEDGVHEINAVGLVLKASENRLSDRLRYIFDSVFSLFGKDMEKNIVVLITHSYGRIPENVLLALEAANIECARDERNHPVHFLFENCQYKDRTKEAKVAWEITMTGMSEFADFLEKSEPQNVEKTTAVLKARIELTTCVQKLQDRIESAELKRKEIQEGLKKAEQEMKSNEKFTVEGEDVCAEILKNRGWLWLEGATCCNHCKETCHYPCTEAWYPKGCTVMRDGSCTVCAGKCSESNHTIEKWRYVTKKRKVQNTDKDKKEKYDKEKAAHESLQKDLLKHMGELEKDKDQWLEESFKHVLDLEKTALNVDSLSTHVHLDFLIERMKEKGDTEKVQKLEVMKSRMDKGTRAGLRYKLTAAGKAVRKTNEVIDMM
ncbi:uncharacterized protein LOC132977357 [Labrus mixtus]|uniref:uncharacterized protein LOC132977357 n=1 Tax=Labrus mixtus TaxID=508554 RepID=UPI0029C09EDA|nr:uncharacterized protein LOC132977357 [Labrus mixtus]